MSFPDSSLRLKKFCMARLIPDDIAAPNQGPWHPSERATLARLKAELSDAYAVFHGTLMAANPIVAKKNRGPRKPMPEEKSKISLW